MPLAAPAELPETRLKVQQPYTFQLASIASSAGTTPSPPASPALPEAFVALSNPRVSPSEFPMM